MVIWKQHIAQSINKTIAELLCVFLIFVSFCPATAIAAETKQTTVRVGYYVNEHFQEGTFDEDKREAYRCGMNGHLAKPINVRELMKELANILG